MSQQNIILVDTIRSLSIDESDLNFKIVSNIRSQTRTGLELLCSQMSSLNALAEIDRGDKETIEMLYKMALDFDDKDFFNQVIPRPLSEEENWYNWNLKNWGTKWDASPECFDVTEIKNENGMYSFAISLQTAWSPPLAFVITLCKQLNVSASLDYIEGGFNFVGVLKVKNGKVVLDDCQPITRESLKHFGYDDGYIEDFFD